MQTTFDYVESRTSEAYEPVYSDEMASFFAGEGGQAWPARCNGSQTCMGPPLHSLFDVQLHQHWGHTAPIIHRPPSLSPLSPSPPRLPL